MFMADQRSTSGRWRSSRCRRPRRRRPPPSPVLVVGILGYADGLYSVDALSTCEELPPRMQHRAPPAKTSAPSETAWTLLREANAIFVASGVPLDAATNNQLTREFRQVRAYPAFRLLVRR